MFKVEVLPVITEARKFVVEAMKSENWHEVAEVGQKLDDALRGFKAIEHGKFTLSTGFGSVAPELTRILVPVAVEKGETLDFDSIEFGESITTRFHVKGELKNVNAIGSTELHLEGGSVLTSDFGKLRGVDQIHYACVAHKVSGSGRIFLTKIVGMEVDGDIRLSRSARNTFYVEPPRNDNSTETRRIYFLSGNRNFIATPRSAEPYPHNVRVITENPQQIVLEGIEYDDDIKRYHDYVITT